MSAPNTTYNSNTSLSLGNIPNVDDPQLYTALLDIHNAIQYLLDSVDTQLATVDTALHEYVDKHRSVSAPITATTYSVSPDDGLILVDATSNDVTITLYDPSGYIGYSQRIKRIDNSINEVTINSLGGATIDTESERKLNFLDMIPVRSDGTNWWIE